MGNLTQLQQIGIGSAGLGILGGAAQGYGQYQQGQEERAAYDYNAAVAIQQMQQAMQTSEGKYDEVIGKQASLYAKAGVDIASGSPLLVMAHTAAQKGVEEERQYQAGTEQSALDKYYGRVAAFRGTMGGIDSFLSGLSKGGMQIASILA